jgi:peptidyl-prolyl cis-trans isomerase D
MLKLMREKFKHLKIILWMVVFVFVLLIFVDWGTGRQGGQRGLQGVAAQVGKTTITERAYLREMRSSEERFRQMYGQQWETVRQQLDLGTMVIQNLIERELLGQQADEMGLGVTDKELLDKITSFPAFHRQDGSFVGPEMYERILRTSFQLTPEEFEGELRSDLKIEKLQKALTSGVVIPDADVEREYRKRNESASFDVMFVGIDRTLAAATPTDADAKAYYDAHQDAFTHPEQRQLRYLLVDDARLRRSIVIPEAQISEYYTTHSSEFGTGEQVRARHILVKPTTQDDAGFRDALTRVREVYGRAVDPKADFAALAREVTDDTGSKESGGDLGWFGRGRFLKEFEDAVFALRPGEISAPVKSQYGYHVIKLEERRSAGMKPLDEVRPQIQSKLAEGLADAEGSRRATTLKEKIDAAKLTSEEQWRGLADDVVSSNVTPFFAQGDTIPGLGRDPEMVAEVMAAKEGFVGGPRRTSRGWVIYRVAAIRKTGTTPFDEAKAEAREGAKRAKALELLKQEVEARRSLLAAGEFTSHEAAFGGKASSVTDHKRGAAIPSVGASQSVEEAVFATPVGGLTPVVEVGDRGVAVARVQAKKSVDPTAFAAEKPGLRASLAQEEMQRLLQSILAEARREKDVTINNDLVDRFKPRQG